MNCAYHDVAGSGFCVRCGKSLCSDCIRNIRGSVYCEDCLAEVVREGASTASGNSAQKEVLGGTNPGAAFVLGLIPGVGAIYNGEFFKAAVHVLIFGSLVQLSSFRVTSALSSLLAFGFYWYMPFEAYYSAKKRGLKSRGVDLETPFDRLYQRLDAIEKKELWGGIALIVLGGLFLLQNFNILRIEWIGRLFWPAVLIGIGVWLLKRHQERAPQ